MKDEEEATRGGGDAGTQRKKRLHTEFFIAASPCRRVCFHPSSFVLVVACDDGALGVGGLRLETAARSGFVAPAVLEGGADE
jgi:hypothetical protein